MSVPFRLQALRGPVSGQSFPIEGGGLTMGRRAGNHVVIGDQRVSGQHARFEVRDGSLYVTDLGSSNGTQVNGAMVAGSRQLRPGDMVQIGESEFRVDGPPAGGAGATMIAGAGGMGGETVIGAGPSAGGQRDLTFGMGTAPLPPVGPPGGGPPAWGAPPPGGGPGPQPGPPPAWGSPPPPAPGWGGPGPAMGPPAVPIVPAPPVYSGASRRKSGPPVPLLVGGALLLLLLLGGGLGALVIGRSKSDPTATTSAATTAPTTVAAAAVTSPTVPMATQAPTAAAATQAPPTAPMPTQPPAVAPTAAPMPTQPPAAPMPTATAAPMPTSPPPPSAPTATKAAQQGRPLSVPSGWRTYTGHPKVPFAIAYPPNWTVDESSAESGSVSFSSPDGTLLFLVNTTGKQDSNANIDVLRDTYATSFVRSFECNKSGVEKTGNSTYSGVQFAFLLQTCDITGSPLKLWDVAAGLKNGVEWDYFFISDYGTYNSNFSSYYGPMLSSLNIYRNP